MKREQILERICFTDNLCMEDCEKCKAVMNDMFNKYDNQIRAEVIDEFEKAFCDNENQRSFITLNQHSHSWDSYAKHIAEQLKEQKCQ